MRRKDKQIMDTDKISRVIKQCQVCRLGLSQNDLPYIVPVSFGFDGHTLYFHTALEGKKTDILAANKNVCFEFETGVQVIENEKTPCNWSFAFQSVIGFGKAEELSSAEDKIKGLTHIVAHYSEKEWGLDKIPLTNIRVWAIHIESMTGKQSPDYADQ